ncbi:Acetyltransferase (GNAT) domain-containing protein [Catalinimonas alkaloidigena]|uniref:Acetyltransferase (GNAT) domain-containing protein n=2 Tax=Catalinimonas alkaloidigena TaxID=1075417 RepID=A0A1G8XRL1_9BACT|nr:Acetyltransferase (GNAT) domain-containing protein [Catalinimonas alkaloidigena]
MIHAYLSQRSYWAQNRTRAQVETSMAHSLCFGAYQDERQVGFARVVTDYAVFAWLADVFVLEDVRGQGVGKLLVRSIVEHPELQLVKRWMLATKDAHDLYRQHGFQEVHDPALLMERMRS